MDESHHNERKFARFDSVDSSDSSNSSVQLRKWSNKPLWRPNSLVNLVSPRKRKVLQSSKSTDRLNEITTSGLSYKHKVDYEDYVDTKPENKKSWNAIVNIIVVEAKGLPDAPSDGLYHTLYCKIRQVPYLGKYRSLDAQYDFVAFGVETLGPWGPGARSLLRELGKRLREATGDPRAGSFLAQRIALAIQRGNAASMMGRGSPGPLNSCVMDLSKLDKDRTHDIWKELDDGFGLIHLNITLCSLRKSSTTDDDGQIMNWHALKQQFAFYKLKETDLNKVGKLQVRVLRAKGLSGKPNAYCTLEVDNETVQTHSVRGTSEPLWGNTYIFNIYDITSTLDVAVYDSSLLLTLRDVAIGQVTIPLLTIKNGELKWYALKNKSKTGIASGNCPRILLEMNLVWNPVKASLKLFQPKEMKYIKKSPKFSTELLYHNVVALGTILEKVPILNDYLIEFLEWDSRELSTVVMAGWLLFWYNFEWWIAPLLLLAPFIYYMVQNYINTCSKKMNPAAKDEEILSFLEILTDKKNDLSDKVQRVPETAVTIVRSTDFMIMHAERLHNLIRLKVPFLSYFIMISLVLLSFAARFIYFKHVMMVLGAYKYMRKVLNPERKRNNDLLDFLSRLPDNNTLREWQELSVPEPENNQQHEN